MVSFRLGPPVQVAYLVDDPGGAAARWAERLGAGPFLVADHIPVSDVTVEGRPGRFDHSSAYGQWGPIMVELVAVHDGGPPPIDGPVHHTAHFVDDLGAALTALDAEGWPVAMVATAGDTRFAFVDARSVVGHYWELYEPTERLRSFYARVAEAADGWDGADPVRRR